jgi:hypothetical protein
MRFVKDFSDSLNILAFRWRSIRPAKNKFWILGALVFAGGLLLATAYFGTMLRTLIDNSGLGTDGGGFQKTILLWLNIFLENNASIAMSGVFWALIASIVLIPLVGYSFASIVPEGDLVSVKVTDNHKIADSIFLQFVSSISFIQIITLTALSSVLTIGVDNPGFGIVIGWLLWTLSVFASVLSAWFFELLHRKFGFKAKVISFVVIITLVGIMFLSFREQMVNFFGLAESYTVLLQSLGFDTLGLFALVVLIFIAISIILLTMISAVGSKTLRVQERPRKTNKNRIIFARLGLVEKNRISNLSQFFINMIIRQSNIWKPLLLSIVFTTGMAVVFFAFYQILFTVSTLIPIMISLVWSINFFGIIGSSTMWLTSLPGVRRDLLKSVIKVQYLIIIGVTLLIAALLAIIYQANIFTLLDFFLATVATTLVITQYSIEKSVYSPHRYRVHIRGESVLPPNKAFSYMIKLFVMGFFMSGLIYGIGLIPYYQIFGAAAGFYAGIIAQILVVLIVLLITRIRFNKLQADWLQDTDILQRIVKTIGTAN